MGDIDQDNQFQPNQMHDDADINVALRSRAENKADHEDSRTCHTRSTEWTDEEKQRLIQLDREERLKGKGFMKRIKVRWDQELPSKKKTAQKLVDTARRFRIEASANGRSNQQEGVVATKKIQWTTEMKVHLIVMDPEEQQKGRGFLKRVKERWDTKYPEYKRVSMQQLRDNASRFKTEKEIINLILVKRRQEIEPAAESLSAELEETVNERNGPHDHQENGETINLERECEMEEETIRDEDKDLEMKFINQLQNLQQSSLEVLPPRNRLEKLKMTKSIEESVERILGKYLKEVDVILEITDVVYAMGKAIAEKIGIMKKDRQQKKKPGNGNRRERKLKAEMKQLCQKIARISNEMHRRKEKRKATKREKRNLVDLKKQMGGVTTTNAALPSYKEIWIDQLRYKKIKFEKMTERGKRIKDNAMFEKDQRNFYRMKNFKGNNRKWKNSLNFGEEYGRRRRLHQCYHGWIM